MCIKSNLKIAIFSFMFSFLSGVCAGWYFFGAKNGRIEKLTVRPLSGEVLTVTKFSTDKNSARIKGQYSGAGESEIIIPFSEIPPAASWQNKTCSLFLGYGIRRAVYFSGAYRFDFLALGAGVRLPPNARDFKNYDLYGGVSVHF